jgi:predicted RNase H-like HicB family nuclease
VLHQAVEGGYVVEIKELSGCLTQAETLEEAIANINEARTLWIEVAYEEGDNIPLPEGNILIRSSTSAYSGKLIVRMPKSLHGRLAEKAKEEKISLNQYIVSVLSGS